MMNFSTTAKCHRAFRLQIGQFGGFTAQPRITAFSRSTFRCRMPSRTIHTFREVSELREYRNSCRKRLITGKNGSVGLVPTMGALHDGHLALARTAAQENDEVFVSIYVNPTQFGVNEDLSSYPRTWDNDLEKLNSLNGELESSRSVGNNEGYSGRVTAVFAPTTKTMYPTLPPTSEVDGEGSFVTITPMGKLLEGASRPVFFRGVATVCTKLFNIVQAERVYFGQKDAQQAALIRRMVKDFHIDTEVRVLPTRREHDGLAMSSRNVYLGARRRKAAALLPELLNAAAKQYQLRGRRARAEIVGPVEAAMSGIQKSGTTAQDEVHFKLDYISLADVDTMEELETIDDSKGAILSAAMLMLPLTNAQPGEDLGENDGAMRVVRLIDNLVLPPVSQSVD